MSDCSQLFPQAAVGAVVFKNDKILLVQRAKAPNAGQWAIPGGRIKPGETLQQAAEREILEETGITIRAGEPIYSFDVIEKNTDGSVRFHYVIVDVLGEYVKGKPQPADDALAVDWVSKKELSVLTVNETTRALLERLFDE